MAGFTFNITDIAAMMNAKDLVTKKMVPAFIESMVNRIRAKLELGADQPNT